MIGGQDGNSCGKIGRDNPLQERMRRGVQTKYTHASFFQKIIKLNQTFFYSTI
ncbi:hypothetical protein H7K20_14425 [Priestia aryabhattai]|nr:hypothetical protein [Priestia aryabhattai]